MLFGTFAASCRATKTIHGRMVDYETHTPLAGVVVFANQSGWGTSGGSVVWDKEYRYRAESGPAGEFVLHYRVGEVARLTVDREGYNRFSGYATPGERIDILLKRLPASARPAPARSVAIRAQEGWQPLWLVVRPRDDRIVVRRRRRDPGAC